MAKYEEFRLLKTPPHGCGYLPNRKAEMLFGSPVTAMSNELYGRLVQAGFRRSGERLYLPHCRSCNACTPIRIEAERFAPRRRHQRTIKRNADLQVRVTDAALTPEALALYKKYIAQKHRQGNMYPASAEQFESFLLSEWGNTRFLEFRLNDQQEGDDAGRLVAVAVTDCVEDALLAVYTFYDPLYVDRSLGMYCILKQIEWVKATNLSYLYLGYWVQKSKKMDYKASYKPHQILIRNRWMEVV